MLAVATVKASVDIDTAIKSPAQLRKGKRAIMKMMRMRLIVVGEVYLPISSTAAELRFFRPLSDGLKRGFRRGWSGRAGYTCGAELNLP